MHLLLYLQYICVDVQVEKQAQFGKFPKLQRWKTDTLRATDEQ